MLCLTSFACKKAEPIKNSEVIVDDGDGPLTPYPETLTVSQAKISNPNITYIDGENSNDNFVTQFFKEKLNVVWQTKWDADASAYTAKLNLDIASNDLPDIFRVSASQMNTLIAADQIMDLTAVYKKYASDKLKNNIEYKGSMAMQSCTVDGKIYGIPSMSSMESDTPFLWLRTDWMEELGLSAPTDYASLAAYIQKVKDSKIANSGGISAGLSFYGPGSISFDSIAQTQNAYYDYWLLDNAANKLVYSGIQPEMKQALLKMQEMYAQGLIDKDFAIKGSTEQELIAMGQYGVVFGQYFYPHLLKGSALNNAKATWKAYAIPANASGSIKPKSSLNVTGYYVVRKDYAHPEALLKTMNLWMEIWQEDGQYRDWFTEKMTTTHKDVYLCGEYALPTFFDAVDNNIKIGKGIRAAFKTENPLEGITSQSKLAQFSFSFMKDETASNYISGEGWALKHVYLYAENVYENDYKQFQNNYFQGVLSEDSAFTKALLDKTMVEEFLNIIMGAPIDDFDKFVDEWNSMGGEDLTKEVNSWYSKQNK